MFFVCIHAQDADRSWAINFNGSVLVSPVLTSNQSNHSTGRGFKAFSLTGEYYFSKKWSAEAGYFRTDVSYGDNTRTMEGMQLGIKRYLLNNSDFFLQPFISASSQLNWSSRKERSIIMQDIYLNSQNTINPIVSFVPGVGADIYILSPVAFVIRYGFNIGFDSKTVIDVRPDSGNPYSLRDRGMFHNLELGIKLTFPFRLSDDEQRSLLNEIKDLFYL